MRGTMMDFPLTLVPILERAGKLFKGIEIVSRRPDRSIARCTYGDIYRRSRRLARALELAGIDRGERVATLMWNHSEHLEAYFGIPLAGGVVHTLNLRLPPEDISWALRVPPDQQVCVVRYLWTADGEPAALDKRQHPAQRVFGDPRAPPGRRRLVRDAIRPRMKREGHVIVSRLRAVARRFGGSYERSPAGQARAGAARCANPWPIGAPLRNEFLRSPSRSTTGG